LNAEELQPDARKFVEKPSLKTGDEARVKGVFCYVCSVFFQVLSIKGGEFSWDKDSMTPTLEDINLTVRKGELIGILGRVGAGKVSQGLVIRVSGV
jgi:ATP-binding cassette, subfamily C (CFTR/MRP), member 1